MMTANDVALERGPLLTTKVHAAMLAAMRRGARTVDCSLDLDRTLPASIELDATTWRWHGRWYPYLDRCKKRTVYHWCDGRFEPVARFGSSLIKLVPTDWGPPTFEIDGVKMLPTQQVNPYEDAKRKVALIAPRGKRVLDTCGGLGYFAAWCLAGGAIEVVSFELNPDVLWLRRMNPWSPPAGHGLTLTAGDASAAVPGFADMSFDAVLHDPPRFGLAGELYSQAFYDQLARVLRPGGRLFHYTGSPNRLTTGRDVPQEVSRRLQLAGFSTRLEGDGVFGVRTGVHT